MTVEAKGSNFQGHVKGVGKRFKDNSAATSVHCLAHTELIFAFRKLQEVENVVELLNLNVMFSILVIETHIPQTSMYVKLCPPYEIHLPTPLHCTYL